jgi:hypothetical protein
MGHSAARSSTHPYPGGHAAHTRSDAGAHGSTVIIPGPGHRRLHSWQEADPRADHMPSAHRTTERPSQAKPASHAQHSALSVEVQLESIRSPTPQLQLMARITAAMLAGRNEILYLQAPSNSNVSGQSEYINSGGASPQA